MTEHEELISRLNESAVNSAHTDAHKVDAKSRGLRTLGQSVLAAVLTFAGTVGADLAVPGFEIDYQTTAFGLAFVALTPVLAYLQRRAGK